jgi:hypothetical protein
MERESFEDDAVAAVMNERFVCIKVDREERADVDDIYMRAVQLYQQGRGGWPMSVWLTPPGARGPDDPGLEPVYAGTYFPKTPGRGRVAFPEICANIAEAWKTQKPTILAQTAKATSSIREQLGRATDPVRIGESAVGQAIALLVRIFDRTHGGFGGAPKFPQPVYLDFLMAVEASIDDPPTRTVVREAIRKTLDSMAMGGMYDQVGGGFHRYSTDEKWLVPHFEKMLYDNGQLASIYAQASLTDYATPLDKRIAREICDYVIREMRDPTGAFWSAQDAEVNAREGQNYLWTPEQLNDVLGEEDGAFAAAVFGVARGTNFRDPHHPQEGASNVLVLTAQDPEMSAKLKMEVVPYRERLEAVREKMYHARAKRDQPITDDKVIAGWNGLMMRGLADTAVALDEVRYLNAAMEAADAIWSKMRSDESGLIRTMRDGVAKTDAVLEDYAIVISGLIAIERAAQSMGKDSGGALDRALELIDLAITYFADPERPGVLYDTKANQSDLIVRAVSTYDGAMACGMSVMALNFAQLHELTADRAWLERSVRTLGAMGGTVRESPVGSAVATRALFHVLTADANAMASIPEGPEPDQQDAPVQIMASTDRVTLTDQGETLHIQLIIENGWHITAAEPGVEGLIPFDVRIAGGNGVRSTVVYPEGTTLEVAGLDEIVHVYDGVVRLKVRLERDGAEWSGRPMLVVRYQACTDSACYEPLEVSLDVAIDPS